MTDHLHDLMNIALGGKIAYWYDPHHLVDGERGNTPITELPDGYYTVTHNSDTEAWYHGPFGTEADVTEDFVWADCHDGLCVHVVSGVCLEATPLESAYV